MKQLITLTNTLQKFMEEGKITILNQNSGEVFRINDLISLGNNLGDITTNCEFVADLTTASHINTATRKMLDVISNSQ